MTSTNPISTDPMGSHFSSPAPQTPDSKVEPPPPPPSDTGSNQEPAAPKSDKDIVSNPIPSQEENGSSQEPADPTKGDGEGGEEEEEEEEEAECGFCLFMKGGGCKDAFIAWEKCVEDSEKNKDDIAEKCYEVTSLLKKCMDAHPDYYEPILSAEKAMADSITEEESERQQAPAESEEGKVEVEVVTALKSEN